MASNEVAIGRDSMGFEDIDEFWDAAVAPAAKSSATEKLSNGKKSTRRSSMATDVTQDTDLELFDYDTSDSIEEEDDEDDDTTDMSAIPADPGSHNHNESLGSKDGFTPFGDDYGDNYDLISDTEEEGEVGRRGERRRSNSLSAKTNRRVSFGMGTKEQMDEDEVEEGGNEMENAESDLNVSVSVRSGRGRGSSIGSSPNVRDRSSLSVTGTSMTPRSTSSSSSSSSSSRKGKYSMGETPGSHEFTRGRIVVDESFVADADDKELENSESDGGDGDGGGDGDEEDNDASMNDRSYVQDTSFLKAIKNRINRQESGLNPRRDSRASTDHEDDDGDELEEEEEEEEEDDGGMRGSRRSSRVTKGKRLAYWRGERPVYQKGRMVGMLVADKTPAKPKKKITKTKIDTKKRKTVSSRNDQTDSEEDESTEQKSKKKLMNYIKETEIEAKIILPTDVTFLKREASDEMAVWDDLRDAPVTVKVLCHAESLRPFSALPVTAIRPPGKEKVGFAAQSFNIPEVAGTMSGWISGFVMLPPGAIKDAEGVGECSQVFFVSECQDGAVELGIADPRHDEWRDDMAQRTLMHKGDSFFVPPGNIYRLENHSSTTPATLFWAIVRPLDALVSPTLSSSSTP